MTADTLPVIAGQINAYLDKAAKADQYRISAGLLLIEARRRVDDGEAGDADWIAWCREHVKRSERDIRRVMRLAGAKDPVAALAQEREATRQRVASIRERTYVRPVPQEEPANADPVSEIMVQVATLSTEDFERFKALFRAYCGGK